MNVLKDFRNDLLKRREVQLEITSEKNPGIVNAIKSVAEHFKANEDSIVLRTLESRFGRGSFVADAFIYDSAADKDKIELKKKEKKKVEAGAPAPAGGKK